MRHALRKNTPGRLDQRFVGAIVIIVALSVFILTWVGIRKGRADSFELLVLQGKAFTEVLAQAAENAIISESFYDYLVHLRYAEIVADLSKYDLPELNDDILIQIAQTHNLYGIFVFAADSTVVAGGIIRGPQVSLPEFVEEEVKQLIADPENNYVLLLEEGDNPGEAIHYYLEISNALDRVVLIMADAVYYVNALEQTQIGYVAQKMAREQSIEYIIYQSTQGIIFSSRATGKLLAIESDPFLSTALEADSISHRIWEFQGQKVLELVRPFSSREYPFGLLRVGLSLDGFYSISRGFDRQMIALAGVLFVLTVTALLYFNSRQKRQELSRQYTHIKTITDKIFEKMRTGVAVVEKSGRITLANDAFSEIFGITESVVGHRWDEVVDVAELSFSRISSLQRTTDEFELTLSTSKGVKTLLVAISKLGDGESEPEGVVLVVYDITRLKEYERKSARKERLSELGNLAAGVAHEIRNPLNTISIAAQRLSAEFTPTEDEDEYRRFTEQIRTETKRLNEIITRFLALAREEKKKHTPVNLSQVITDTLSFLKLEAEKLGIAIKADIQPEIYYEADADAVKQVVLNLFANAKEALEGRAGCVTVSLRRHDAEIELLFSDNGPGIPPELRDKIFTPYFTTKESGTGLGLATVHTIVTEMGGEIRLEESEKGGTCFVIILPQNRPFTSA